MDIDMPSADADAPSPSSPHSALSPQSPLRIMIQIQSAETENAGKHHINVRRTSGGHWRFKAFYTAFRREMSAQLGLPNEQSLSAFSPMLRKRELEPNACAAVATGWSRDTAQTWRGGLETAGISRASKRPMWQPLQRGLV